jgi:hypothetical protein
VSGQPFVTFVSVTVSTAGVTGSSAANPDLVGAVVLGYRANCAGNSVYNIRSIVVNADGSVTVTTSANPTGASLIVVISLAKFQ